MGLWSVTGRERRTHLHVWHEFVDSVLNFPLQCISETTKQNPTDGILNLVDRCLAVIPPAEQSLPRENDIQCHIDHICLRGGSHRADASRKNHCRGT